MFITSSLSNLNNESVLFRSPVFSDLQYTNLAGECYNLPISTREKRTQRGERNELKR
ncbi:hypothetical protein BVRB_9g206460 [Beta vulgaris subsp. vulgaris]|uniref:Uncharacterized protein n=1 Tax=Beta vulgaris subsp. vulgaris TaxID=3555 RepID=A0A0J8BQP0_BETVV|nr:hypothetical protein BVRB_9g206460 [Beta vulgaris subsp. vulgaris]